jgi:hypothetical protein
MCISSKRRNPILPYVNHNYKPSSRRETYTQLHPGVNQSPQLSFGISSEGNEKKNETDKRENELMTPPANLLEEIQEEVAISISQSCVPRFCRSDLFLVCVYVCCVCVLCVFMCVLSSLSLNLVFLVFVALTSFWFVCVFMCVCLCVCVVCVVCVCCHLSILYSSFLLL